MYTVSTTTAPLGGKPIICVINADWRAVYALHKDNRIGHAVICEEYTRGSAIFYVSNKQRPRDP